MFVAAEFSYRRNSKFSLELLLPNNTARHSMLKIRLGEVPDTDV